MLRRGSVSVNAPIGSEIKSQAADWAATAMLIAAAPLPDAASSSGNTASVIWSAKFAAAEPARSFENGLEIICLALFAAIEHGGRGAATRNVWRRRAGFFWPRACDGGLTRMERGRSRNDLAPPPERLAWDWSGCGVTHRIVPRSIYLGMSNGVFG